MTDINQRVRDERPEPDGRSPLLPADTAADTAGEPALVEIVELLFFAYRDFICEPDAILAEFGFGRAHHRVLHFVSRYPGLRVADLLTILKITKQSLGRVLKQLVDEGYIAQHSGRADRRERLLYPTAEGQALAGRLARPQLERIARSLDNEGGMATEPVRDFLYRMVSESDRAAVSDLLSSASSGSRAKGGEE